MRAVGPGVQAVTDHLRRSLFVITDSNPCIQTGFTWVLGKA